jgi:hypothetical protein
MTRIQIRRFRRGVPKLIGSTITNKPLPEFNDPKLLRSAWEKYSAISDKYYKPGSSRHSWDSSGHRRRSFRTCIAA